MSRRKLRIAINTMGYFKAKPPKNKLPSHHHDDAQEKKGQTANQVALPALVTAVTPFFSNKIRAVFLLNGFLPVGGLAACFSILFFAVTEAVSRSYFL